MNSTYKQLTSKSAANMSSDSMNISGAEGFFGLVPAEQINGNDCVQCHCIKDIFSNVSVANITDHILNGDWSIAPV